MQFRRALLALALACATGAFAYDAAPEPVRALLGLPTVRDGSDGEATASRRVRGKRRRAGTHVAVARTSPGTYLGRILQQRDSVLDRWPARIDAPIRVWIADGDPVTGWKPTYRARLAEAFADWESTGLPIRFAFVGDSAGAEVRVRWVDTLSEHASGRTTWRANGRRWMTGADVWIAMRASDDAPQDERGIKAIALHEIGHLLGLSHSGGKEDIMAAWVTADTLSDGDRATARLLYALPPGRVSRAE